MNIEFIRLDGEDNRAFAERVIRVTRLLGLRILNPDANGPEDIDDGVRLKIYTTDNGDTYRYETDT